MTKKSDRMRNRTMLGQTLISVSTCPTTITSAIILTIVNGIRQKGIPYLFLWRIQTAPLKELVADKNTV